MILFVDSWGWLVLEDHKDPRHQTVSRFYRACKQDHWRIVTSDYVLCEVITRLFQRRPFLEAKRFMEGAFQASEEGHLTLARVNDERFRAAWGLRLRYDDQPGISFPDLTSFTIMREMGIETVLTQDRHFRIAGFTLVP